MEKPRIKVLLKPLLFILIAFVFLTISLGYILGVITSSDYFTVKDITKRGDFNINLSYLIGKNIFSLNLPYESAHIEKSCSDCLRVKIARVMPNRLFVDFIRRKPVALVKLSRYFAVDLNGVLFNPSESYEDLNLPLITGLDKRIPSVTLGKAYKIKELNLALSIIKEAGRFMNLRDYPISKIEVGPREDIILFIIIDFVKGFNYGLQIPDSQKMLEVRVSQGNIIEKIAVMSGLINQEKHQLFNIKYIDLRFKEPVIKFKDAIK
ncbi:MAG: hypothetical protein FJZ12_00610 [Candidatus Omnitrophica bacterium]|nr:hypothetical protein [Candidatus Omnitrophota bacterium]